MTKYTIAERQELKSKLADVKYFEQDLQLFTKVYPHHVINDECKRANQVNKAALHSRMIYVLLTRATKEEIITNRKNGKTNEVPSQFTESARNIKSRILIRMSGWKQKIANLISGCK